MKKEIILWLKQVCPKYKMGVIYSPESDIYLIHKNGRAIQGFDTKQFYQVPKRKRAADLLPLMTRGLMLNSGEKYASQLLIQRHNARKII